MSKLEKLQKRLDVEYSDDRIVTVRDKQTGAELFRWNDNAQCDYPEDLCWYREIRDVFAAGMEAAIKMFEAESQE
jgi:hypothetical protein